MKLYDETPAAARIFCFLTLSYLLQSAFHFFDSWMETNAKTELVGEDVAEIETEAENEGRDVWGK